ncbi:hypothetical protein KAI87_16060 [Myxococcota bacterium]|nr:hypothetical protein [Myxococcota bacterium]
MKTCIWLLLATLIYTPLSAAETQPQTAEKAKTPKLSRLLVLELSSTGVDANTAKALTEVLTQTLRQALPDVAVMGQSEINSMLLLEKERDLLGCASDIACLAEIGGALGADHLIVGSVGKIGTLYLLNIKLLDSATATTVGHVSAEVTQREELLVEATRQWATKLVKPKEWAGFGFLSILGRGEILIDGQSAGAAPLSRLPMAPGAHTISWRSATPPTSTLSREVQLEAYETLRISPPKVAAKPLTIEQPPPKPVPELPKTANHWLLRAALQYPFPGIFTKGHSYDFQCQTCEETYSETYSDTFALASGSGLDLTLVYMLSRNHALTLATSYALITLKSDMPELGEEDVLEGAAYSTMVGYQYIFGPLGPFERLRPYAGFLAGVLMAQVEAIGSPTDDGVAYRTGDPDSSTNDSVSDMDFSFAPELGLRWELPGHIVLDLSIRLSVIMPLLAGTGLMYAPISLGAGFYY